MVVPVDMYKPRIPISGGGGGISHLDLREDEMSPIMEAFAQVGTMIQRDKQNKLAQQALELERQKMQQPQAMQGQIIFDEDNNAIMVDRRTGQKTPLGIKGDNKIISLLNSMSQFWRTPGGVIDPEQERQITEWGLGEFKKRTGQPTPIKKGGDVIQTPEDKALMRGEQKESGKWQQPRKVLKKTPITESLETQLKSEPEKMSDKPTVTPFEKGFNIATQGGLGFMPKEQEGLPQPKTKDEYDKLPKGTKYKAPNGEIKIKQ